MDSDITHYFSDKLNQIFENNIKLSFVLKTSKKNIIIITKEDKVYQFNEEAITNSLLVFSNNQFIIEQKIKESLIEELSNKGIIDFSSSDISIIARTIDGKLYCWGNNRYGGLGNGRHDDKEYKPELNEYLLNKHIIEMSCGYWHSVVLTSDGQVYTWGLNNAGQSGNKNCGERQLIPYNVNEFNGEKVKSISCGYCHTLALTDSGCVYSWGDNEWGQLGRNNNKWKILPIKQEDNYSNCPKPIKLSKNVTITNISCGRYHSLLLSFEKDIYVFGCNENGELGINKQCNKQLSPIKLNISQKFTEIASRFTCAFSCALSINGLYYIWGIYGKEGIFSENKENIIREPKETQFKSFNEIFSHYFGVTLESISDRSFLVNDKLKRNGYFENKYKERKLIGNGCYGEVYNVKELNTPSMRSSYAIKRFEINFSNDIKEEDLSKELENFSVINNLYDKNIVRYYDLWFENESIERRVNTFIKMELCDQSLKDLINDTKIINDTKLYDNNSLNHLAYYLLSQLFIQILEGVDYLHTRIPQIIHRDIKPDNILLKITNLDKSIIKIADMGLICLHYNDRELSGSLKQYHTEDIGPIQYAAPEVLDSRKYDTRSDIYSLGVVLQELFQIHENRDYIESDGNSIIGNKYQELSKLCFQMQNEDIDQRPQSCRKILNDKRFWTLNENEFEVEKEFKEFCHKCDEKYRESYIFKIFINLLSQCLTIHRYFGCAECTAKPIVGNRYKCNECESYDLCESCFKRFDINHSELHTFRKVFRNDYISYIDSSDKNLNFKDILKNIKFLYIFNDTKYARNDAKDDLIFNAIVVTKEDQTYAFGSNENGMLGIDNTYKVKQLTIIKELCNKGIIEFKNTYSNVMARTSEGKLYYWGYNEKKFMEKGFKYLKTYKPKMKFSLKDKLIMEMSCGGYHILVLTIDGEVYEWGYYKNKQIKNNDSIEIQNIPYCVSDFNDQKVKSISCGESHSLALTQNGSVYSWGLNEWHQLGRYTEKDETTSCPKLIDLNEEIIIEKISCGHSHSLLLGRNGDIYVFGRNCDNELGINTKSDKQLFAVKLNNCQKFKEIGSHWTQHFSCALSENGLYYIWGKLSYGKIIREPKETQFTSFNEIFMTYFEITVENESNFTNLKHNN